jgi:antitoxin component of MazEF toxin-antitoxin module
MKRQEIRARMDKKGGVAIPAAFLKALKLQAGDEVMLRLVDGELRISTRILEVEHAQRNVRRHVQPGISLVEELLAERRAEARRK